MISNEIIYAVTALGGMGLIFGVMLAIASKYLGVEVDERITQITEILPGANCGGCGYAGCDAFATAVVAKTAPVNGCSACSKETVKQIAKIMKTRASAKGRMVALVQCAGNSEVANEKYAYDGITDCVAASLLAGGPKACAYGCMGLGTCVTVCKFDAISVVNGVAVVNATKCTACGMCKKACPKKVIELVPAESTVWVLCSSRDKAAVTKSSCTVGCGGCKLCEKTCEAKAIKVKEYNATIDYEKCTKCGECVLKCPKKIIMTEGEPPRNVEK